jgi:FMN phosphatase YigB (HAD superfamily)
MKLLIDFDGVLFDSKTFRDDLIAEIQKSGFSSEEVRDTYNMECLDGNYLPLDHLNRLKIIKDFNIRLAEARIENLVKINSKYIYPDVIDSLKKITKLKNYQLELITLGHPKYQPRKVKFSGIEKYFKKIHYTSIPKVEYLQRILDKNDKFIIVDDRGDTLEAISLEFLKAVMIEMRRVSGIHDPAEQSSHFSGPKISDLKQLIEIL